MLRGDDTLEDLTPAARRLLDEAYDSTAEPGVVPLTVCSVAQQARRVARGATVEIAGARLPTRSGGWIRMDASLLDDDPGGRVAVIISPAREPRSPAWSPRSMGCRPRSGR